ncbi:MAG: hypothetical protein IKI50_00810 [Clostridia bacterium]|nr:hypothetical protein [Clostridia bacterium]
MKKSIAIILALAFVLTCTMAVSVSADAAVDVAKATPTIDGKISTGEWDGSTWITLDAATYQTAAGADGSGWVNHQPAADDQFSCAIALRVDENNLYIVEKRENDAYFIFGDTAGVAFFYDGNGICLVKNGTLGPVISCLAKGKTVETPRIDIGGKQDIAGVEAKATFTDTGYVLEIAIPWSELGGVTLADFEAGIVGVTYYVVNIFDEAYASTPEDATAWAQYSYQLQYKGVGAWAQSPAIAVVDAPANPGNTGADTGAESAVAVAAGAVIAAAALVVLTKKK